MGAPAATHSNQLELNLRLAKTTSDPPVWTHTITGSESHTSWIYALKPDFEYDAMLKQGMRGALESLRQAARDLPPVLSDPAGREAARGEGRGG